MRRNDPFDPMRAFYQPNDPLSEISINIKLSMPRGTNAELVAKFIEDLKHCMEIFECYGTRTNVEVDETIAL